MTLAEKPSPDTGKVAAEPSEGASWSKNKRIEISVSRNKRMMYLYSVFSGLLLVKNERIRLYFPAGGTNDTKGGIYDKIKLLSFSVKKTSLHKK